MDSLQGVAFHNAVGLHFMLSLCYVFSPMLKAV